MNPSTAGRILTMNRGSSTLKAAIYEADSQNRLVLSMNVDRADSSSTQIAIKDARGKSLFDSRIEKTLAQEADNHGSAATASNPALDAIFDWLEQNGYLNGLVAAGHRLVHGGVQFRKPLLLTPEVLAELEELVPLDPDHLPAALAGIHFISQRLPELPQIACFDTAFHTSLPTVARMYALPRRFFDGGIIRFGFHGLSYEYVAGELAKLDGPLADGCVIIAHLGSGASMVALRHGKSVDTSMGFTPLEGLVMGTRSGDLDPGAILYLLEQGKMSPADLDKCLNKESGLLGISGATADMRDLLERSAHDPHAAEAVDLFCYRAKKYVGAYAAALGGLDLLVFTGGIGEKAAPVREKICEGLEFLGLHLDPQRNQSNAPIISTPGSAVKVRVIETNEDLTIVRHVLSILHRTQPKVS